MLRVTSLFLFPSAYKVSSLVQLFHAPSTAKWMLPNFMNL